MFERFTDAARAVLVAAHEESGRLSHDYLGTEHLLLGLLHGRDDAASAVLAEFGVGYERFAARLGEVIAPGADSSLDTDALRSVGIDLDAVRRRVAENFGPGALERPVVDRDARASPAFTPRARKVLLLAARAADDQHSDPIGTEHLLLGIVHEGNGLAARLLTESGADLPALRTALSRPTPHPS